MAQTQQWTRRDQFWHVMQLFVAFIFLLITFLFALNIQLISDWFARIMSNLFNIPDDSQLILKAIGSVVGGLGSIISSFIALMIMNMRGNRRFRKRLGRAIVMLIILAMLALLFLLFALFFLGVSNLVEFLADMSSGMTTEIAGVFLTVLLIDTFGRSWEEWDEESIAILDGRAQNLSELAQKLMRRKQAYVLKAEAARQISKSWLRRMTTKDYVSPAYYEGAIAALDSVLSELPSVEAP